MSLLSFIGFPKSRPSDSLTAVSALLRSFHSKYTHKKINEDLTAHLDYPSLLAVKDSLMNYGVESTAIRKGVYRYADFETPFICSIQKDDWPRPLFTTVLHADDSLVTYVDPITGAEKKMNVAQFEQIDKEVLLLLDGDRARDEVNYKANRRSEALDKLLTKLPLALGIAILLFVTTYLLVQDVGGSANWMSLIYLFTSSIGLSSTALLLWHSVDAHDPFLREVCGSQGRKINCGAVLSSNGADFLGISWAAWGFAYFAAFVLFQILYPGQLSQIMLWSMVSLVAVPYTVYSFYYQWKIVQQWCPLCLSVQAVLLLNAAVSLVFLMGDLRMVWEGYTIGLAVIFGSSFLLLAYYGVPMAKQIKDSRRYERKWKRLRYHPDIFHALLGKSNAVTSPVEGLGIVLGNPTATHEIIKVCNPYCGPCSKAHPALEQIIKQRTDVRLRIIFTANGEDSDMRTAPVAHLLAIEQKHGREKVQSALDDWYGSETKDYEAFRSRYPMNGELAVQKAKIEAMRDWCEAMKIRATPTVYVNGRELPDSYGIDELKNFF